MSGGRAVWCAADQPWIDTMDEQGVLAVLSAGEVIEQAERVHLASPDPLLRAATVRLLVAFAYAAGCAPATDEAYARQVDRGLDLAQVGAWLHRHTAELDLFDPGRPLFQDGDLHPVAEVPGVRLPVHSLDHTASTSRPLLSDLRHALLPIAVGPAAAFQLLLVQQMWATGGKIAIPETVYGVGSSFGRPAAATGGMVWWPAGTVADLLAWRLIPVPGGPGPANWTYRPRGHGRAESAPVGELDALTWHDRRVLLLPEADGTVRQVLCAQGWRRVKDAEHPWLQPGGHDRVTSRAGNLMSAHAVAGEGDTAPLVARWWDAPQGSWPYAVRQAAAHCGRTPDVIAAGLAVETHAKICFQREVFLPGRLLADPRTTDAARAVWRFRVRAPDMTPRHRPDLEITAPPDFGARLLEEELFLNADPAARCDALCSEARPASGAAPARRGEQAAVLAAITQTFPALPPPPSSAGSRDDAGTAVPNAAEPDRDVRADPDDGEQDAGELDDAYLFATADDDFEDGDPFGEPLAAAVRDPARVLSRRLGGMAGNAHRRGILGELVHWMVLPRISNAAIPLVTAGLPPQAHEAAMITAGLFATHRQLNPRGPMYGHTPLPRLARAFGSGRTYGPAHPATRIGMELLLATGHTPALRVRLVDLVRYAATRGMAPDWAALFTDLALWDRPVRDRWAELFYTKTPVPPRVPLTFAPVSLSSAKDQTSA